MNSHDCSSVVFCGECPHDLLREFEPRKTLNTRKGGLGECKVKNVKCKIIAGSVPIGKGAFEGKMVNDGILPIGKRRILWYNNHR